MTPRISRYRIGLRTRIEAPLAVQMVAILVCALLAAQLVTLMLTVALPPAPAARWDLDEVARALSNAQELPSRLERRPMIGPPDVSGQGWLVSESSRNALAQRLNRPASDVILAFYTQLPVGGVAVPGNTRSPMATTADAPARQGGLSSLIIDSAQAQPMPGQRPNGGMPGRGAMPGMQFPHTKMPAPWPGQATGTRPPAGRMPDSQFPDGRVPDGQTPGGRLPGDGFGGQGLPSSGRPAPNGSRPDTGQLPDFDGNSGQHASRPDVGLNVVGPPSPRRPSSVGQKASRQPRSRGFLDIPYTPFGPVTSSPRTTVPSPTVETVKLPKASLAVTRAAAESDAATPGPTLQNVPAASERITPAAGAITAIAPAVPGTAQPIPFRRPATTPFTLTPAPFIEGDFVAALRQDDGQWIAVAPRAEPFPNAWQKRVMLWFALSLAVVSPLAWLFVRRIVVPLGNFAQAAEQLGRDPSANILPLSGPAEIGRAAHAFNQMHNRLRAFVDDRTAMVGAISHDLRTPLTRLRFRIEDVPDDQRDGLLKEVTEMEAMISQVIAFIRDASTPDARQHNDFAHLVARSVEDARLVGGDVTVESTAQIPVIVDPVGIRRLLDNVLENAVKYGESARVRVSLSQGDAIAEILDTGPGIPEEEYDRAFEPFYRLEAAQKSGQGGSGLGLAVCRSIARAHGGDVSFSRTADGFVVRVAVPASPEIALRATA